MVIERQRKADAKEEEDSQHRLLIKIREEQTKKVNDQDQNFSRHHVRHDRADKKTFLAFEDYSAGRATGPEMERFGEDRRGPTGWAMKFETSTEREENRARISFHVLGHRL